MPFSDEIIFNENIAKLVIDNAVCEKLHYFLPPIALRETKSVSDIAHNLSRILESLAKLSNILGFIKSF